MTDTEEKLALSWTEGTLGKKEIIFRYCGAYETGYCGGCGRGFDKTLREASLSRDLGDGRPWEYLGRSDLRRRA